MNGIIEEIKEYFKDSSTIKLLCFIFILGAIFGSIVTTYINIINNQTIQHKIDKGEVMIYTDHNARK